MTYGRHFQELKVAFSAPNSVNAFFTLTHEADPITPLCLFESICEDTEGKLNNITTTLNETFDPTVMKLSNFLLCFVCLFKQLKFYFVVKAELQHGAAVVYECGRAMLFNVSTATATELVEEVMYECQFQGIVSSSPMTLPDCQCKCLIMELSYICQRVT